MPSPRRMRVLAIAAIATVVFILFYSSGIDSGEGSFYDKTLKAMHPQGQSVINTRTGEKAGHIPADTDGDGDVDEEDRKAKDRQRAAQQNAQQKALDSANKKNPVMPDPPSKVIGVGNSGKGQDKPEKPKGAVAKAEKAKEKVAEPELDADSDEFNAAAELKRILSEAPVVIISKTYCPHSKRTKGILLEKYAIKPQPYVFELDKIPQASASALQDELEKKTGRRTVPNIMINGHSIGGNDLIVDMDEHNELTKKIQDLGQRKVQISRLLEPEQHAGAEAHH